MTYDSHGNLLTRTDLRAYPRAMSHKAHLCLSGPSCQYGAGIPGTSMVIHLVLCRLPGHCLLEPANKVDRSFGLMLHPALPLKKLPG